MLIRDAIAADAAAIAAIHNHAVAHTAAIWTEQPTDPADRAAWIAERQGAGFPVLVADRNGGVIGYASYGPWRARDGYRYTVEHSVYVAQAVRRQGTARALLAELIVRARAAGLHAMIGGVASDNAASIALHARFGFRETGRLPQVGAKFGRWLDLVFLQLTLDDRASPPTDDAGRP